MAPDYQIKEWSLILSISLVLKNRVSSLHSFLLTNKQQLTKKRKSSKKKRKSTTYNILFLNTVNKPCKSKGYRDWTLGLGTLNLPPVSSYLLQLLVC